MNNLRTTAGLRRGSRPSIGRESSRRAPPPQPRRRRKAALRRKVARVQAGPVCDLAAGTFRFLLRRVNGHNSKTSTPDSNNRIFRASSVHAGTFRAYRRGYAV